ncbi:MAG TPA: pitrilysin family protein [Bacteroidia bacterium]|nr:pitrilysin family protein [Bacteroidia bacterium]HNT79608.1 pitrilysin family protein [Bacteroidia bacterium]
MSTTIPSLLTADSISLRPLQTQHSKNGMPLHYVEDHSIPICSICFAFRAGVLYEDQKLSSVFSSSMLDEGSRDLNYDTIADYIESFGASLEKENSERFVYLKLFCLSKHANELLRFLKKMLLNATFPEDRLSLKRQQFLQSYRLSNSKVSSVAWKNFKKELFGAHSSLGYIEIEKDYLDISHEHLISFFEERYLNAPLQIFAAGDLNKEIIAALLDYELSDASAKVQNDSPLDENAVEPTPVFKQIAMESSKVQSSIVCGLPWMSRASQEYTSAFLLITILGGYFGSRLMKVVREEKGYTYGIQAFVRTIGSFSYMAIQAELDQKNVEATLQEISVQMEQLRSERIDVEELRRAKNYLSGIYLTQSDTVFKTMRLYRGQILDQLDTKYFENQYDRMMNCSAEELNEVAKKYLSPDLLTKIVAG